MEETMSKLSFNMKKIINNIRNNQKNIQNINKAIKWNLNSIKNSNDIGINKKFQNA